MRRDDDCSAAGKHLVEAVRQEHRPLCDRGRQGEDEQSRDSKHEEERHSKRHPRDTRGTLQRP